MVRIRGGSKGARPLPALYHVFFFVYLFFIIYYCFSIWIWFPILLPVKQWLKNCNWRARKGLRSLYMYHICRSALYSTKCSYYFFIFNPGSTPASWLVTWLVHVHVVLFYNGTLIQQIHTKTDMGGHSPWQSSNDQSKCIQWNKKSHPLKVIPWLLLPRFYRKLGCDPWLHGS